MKHTLLILSALALIPLSACKDEQKQPEQTVQETNESAVILEETTPENETTEIIVPEIVQPDATITSVEENTSETPEENLSSEEITQDTNQPDENQEAYIESFEEMNASRIYAFATAEGQANGAVFLTIKNTSNVDDELIAVSPYENAERTELHSTVMEDGKMVMRKVDSIEIKKGETLELKPKSYHIMLMGLTEPLIEGNSFSLELTFKNFGPLITDINIIQSGSTPEEAAIKKAKELEAQKAAEESAQEQPQAEETGEPQEESITEEPQETEEETE